MRVRCGVVDASSSLRGGDGGGEGWGQRWRSLLLAREAANAHKQLWDMRSQAFRCLALTSMMPYLQCREYAAYQVRAVSSLMVSANVRRNKAASCLRPDHQRSKVRDRVTMHDVESADSRRAAYPPDQANTSLGVLEAPHLSKLAV